MNILCTPDVCPVILSSNCVFYRGEGLIYTGIVTNDTLQAALKKIDDTIATGGQSNTASNVGTGDGLFKQKVGVDLQFKSLLAGNNITLIPGADSITIEADTGTPESVFGSNVTFILSSGKTFGKYSNGQTAPWTGLTAREAILDAALEYINPVFTAFSVAQATTVEVGTTITGNKDFTWSITPNSGVVPTVDIFDITSNLTLLAGTPNDGAETQAVATIQLNSNGATQQWRAIGNNTLPAGTFNSSTFTVTSRFYRWWGVVASTPSNSTQVRALANSAFQTAGNSFTLATGTTLTKFSVNLPPGVTIVSVIDTTNLNLNITADYVLIGTVPVVDAGGVTHNYNQYEMNVGVPYPTSANHVITTS